MKSENLIKSKFSATMENGGNGKSADGDEILLAEHFDERQIT